VKNFFKILKCKKGLTLTELIMSILIFTIITGTVSAVLGPLLRTYMRANELAELNTLLDTIANRLITDISDATVPVGHGPNSCSISIGSNVIIYTVGTGDDDDGVLLKSVNDSVPTPILSKIYYDGKSVRFNLTGGPGVYMLNIEIFSDRDGRVMIDRDYAIRPLVLNQYIAA